MLIYYWNLYAVRLHLATSLFTAITSHAILFLLRALQPPNWLPQWHCGVRVKANNKLVGFIAAVPADVLIYET